LGRLSTHVLDTSSGNPAADVSWKLYFLNATDGRSLIGQGRTNANGRTDAPMLEGDALRVGEYELVFETAAYFKAQGTALSNPPFLDRVPIRFAISNTEQNTHVPLLISPFGYTTYRGS
jgi:5-hydroxyisourate hydrolase